MVLRGAEWKIHPTGGVEIYFDTSLTRRAFVWFIRCAQAGRQLSLALVAVNNDSGDVIYGPIAPPARPSACVLHTEREKTPPDITRTIFAHNTAILDLARRNIAHPAARHLFCQSATQNYTRSPTPSCNPRAPSPRVCVCAVNANMDAVNLHVWPGRCWTEVCVEYTY